MLKTKNPKIQLEIIEKNFQRYIPKFSTYHFSIKSFRKQSEIKRFKQVTMTDTVLDNFFMNENKIKNKKIDSFEEIHKKFFLKDMVNLLEIQRDSKKLLHAPSLKIFLLHKISSNIHLD